MIYAFTILAYIVMVFITLMLIRLSGSRRSRWESRAVWTTIGFIALFDAVLGLIGGKGTDWMSQLASLTGAAVGLLTFQYVNNALAGPSYEQVDVDRDDVDEHALNEDHPDWGKGKKP